MFTGLVERTGHIVSSSQSTDHIWTVVVDPGLNYEREHGASIAVNGVCLTEVGSSGEGHLTFQVSHETKEKTSLSDLSSGTKVNLERAMRPTDRLGGHIMLGHVDCTGTVKAIESQQGFHILEIIIPTDLAKYVVTKGSIAIDGTSLTINKIKDSDTGCHLFFTIIPVTWTTTRLANVKINDKVNIEVDMIAKHLERLTSPWKIR